MSKIDDLILKVKEGSLQPNKAAEKIKAIVMGSTRPSVDDDGYADYALQRVADKDDEGYEDSFNKVVAAWIAGDLSDSQYHTIREIVTANAQPKEQAPDDEAEDDDEQ